MSTASTTIAHSTAFTRPIYTLVNKTFPDHVTSLIEVRLADHRDDDLLAYFFALSTHDDDRLEEAPIISVANILTRCEKYLIPTGFYLKNRRTLQLFYRFENFDCGGEYSRPQLENLQRDDVASACDRLNSYLQDLCDDRDRRFRRNPETSLIERRKLLM